ncbi:flagellar biosynthesis protein FlhB [Spirochaeta isovalerica]|uniref:Flagellar biosynthetic protein FlhB n=1 Tax=Spirochaeta isovalerica TaxID=150 RepID=A0A841RI11_9SPIO|nr:flagellar biosynthesis protein FlhB [Spirochaeta isovalerica]MBB6481942.1 flagellar biosynthetic protein FlhB [Spirochaeta isovalerica]
MSDTLLKERFLRNDEYDLLLRSMDLQWFAAEDEGRTEDPTEQKKKKAREEGKVAKTQELTASLVMLFPLVAIGVLSGYMINQLAQMINFFLKNSTVIDVAGSGLPWRAFLGYFLKLTLPIWGIAYVSAFLGNVVQVGFKFTPKAIKPDFKKIKPDIINWAKKSLFSLEALFNFTKSILKIIIIGVVSYLDVRKNGPQLANLTNIPLGESFSFVAGIAFGLAVKAALILMALSLPDYLFQRKQHLDSLKMTKHEVKEEHKQMEGDPLIKSRLRQRMQEILTSNMIQNVPQADVVVTNPTHFAVALEWNNETMIAPTVTAKGQDHIAFRIRDVAKENDVPVIENKPLARGLYAAVEIGEMIPEEYWDIVSRVLAEVYRISGKMAGEM